MSQKIGVTTRTIKRDLAEMMDFIEIKQKKQNFVQKNIQNIL